MHAIPLTILPLILYNVVVFALAGSLPPDPWSAEIFGVTMVSGTRFSFSLGHLTIALGLVLLFFEIFRSTRSSSATIVNHMVSTLVLVAYVLEFVLVGAAAHPVFLILTLIALFDVMAGFTISIRTAARDISFDNGV